MIKMNKNDKIISNFLKFIKQIKGDYFLFGHIPEEELLMSHGRRKGDDDDDPMYSWAYTFFNDNDAAIDIVISFMMQVLACLITMERYDKLAKIKELADSAYETINDEDDEEEGPLN